MRVSPPGWWRSNIFPKALPKQEQPSVFPTSFSILGGVGWLQPESQLKIHQPPNKDSPKKNASLPQLQHHVIMLRRHVILQPEVRSPLTEKKQELDSSCQTSSKCMLFTQTFHTRFVLSGTFPWENKGTRSRRSSSVTSSHGSLPKTGCHHSVATVKPHGKVTATGSRRFRVDFSPDVFLPAS